MTFCICIIFCCCNHKGLIELTFELLAAPHELLHQFGHFWVGCLVVKGRLGKRNNNIFTEISSGTSNFDYLV